ncbi:hypothetical protein K443DRAFT_672153 [Laccaria amethystina LaAM-08-1]|uniref:Uncharacterized protein n=1 Tax=Laccaria amethystina LaAM-08-1 TaxID=1095629 RepID=A0A0C9Y400_9AGAR|nr:hypothetical protein K443DRAFT_672153 [Laccaria amethystina LaAM-08-1]
MSHPRIKVLGKLTDVPEPNDHQHRRPVKRLRVTIESEDDDEKREELSISHSMPSSLDSLTDDELPESSTSKAAVPAPPKNPLKQGTQAKTKANGPPRKKPRKLVVTDPESEDYDDSVQQVSEEDDEHEPVMEDKRPKVSKVGKTTFRKEAGVRKGVKRLHKTEPSNVAEAQPPITKGDATLRPASKLPELLIDVVGGGADEPQAVDSPLANVDDSAVSAKKRTRLPTIKKNKVPTLTAPSTPSTPAIASKLDPAIAALKVGEPKQGAARAAAIAATDLDLGNKSVYNELFRGGNTSAGGSSNRRTKEEERRKELHRMREDARSKRALEATVAFDLQAQHEKISRFEDKLKAAHSSALYPNFLAAKWREEYELERRRRERAQEGMGTGLVS